MDISRLGLTELESGIYPRKNDEVEARFNGKVVRGKFEGKVARMRSGAVMAQLIEENGRKRWVPWSSNAGIVKFLVKREAHRG